MPFYIDIGEAALRELKKLRVYDRRLVVGEIEKQLTHQPTLETRNRKVLQFDPDLEPDFAHEPPIWELRIDEFRVFYDVSEIAATVTIRAVRRKRPGQTTEDIINEKDNA
jgi:mRNA-degrading endonuclease RelE of RelBE toxin-antitoxin system